MGLSGPEDTVLAQLSLTTAPAVASGTGDLNRTAKTTNITCRRPVSFWAVLALAWDRFPLTLAWDRFPLMHIEERTAQPLTGASPGREAAVP